VVGIVVGVVARKIVVVARRLQGDAVAGIVVGVIAR
jgi:hypothetical protein